MEHAPFVIFRGDDMKPVIDLNREYAIMLDGGGARGAYQIGAWKALREAGIKINAVAGTSVGALNGALICMGDIDKAEEIWKEITFSRVMDVDDDWMERLFNKENKFGEVLKELREMLSNGGVDVAPLRELIHEAIDERKIRSSGIEFCVLTFSVTDMKELDLSIYDIPEGMLEDFLLASAYLVGFKREKLHGKVYMDGGVVNNVPLGALIDRGYKDIIEIRIFGPGREPRVRITEEMTVHQIAPRVRLGSIIEFHSKRSRQNMKIGYYDAKRMIYGLEGRIYYIEQTHEECYYKTRIQRMSEVDRVETAFELRMPLGYTEVELYMAMLEASAKILRIQKYKIYTVDELFEAVCKKYNGEELPKFVHILTVIGKEYESWEMADRMKTNWAGRYIYEYEEIDSTNLCAARLADEGAEHGTLVVAQAQSAGRGRRGRSWDSPAGENVYLSLLLRPEFAPDKAPMLTLLMAYSVALAVKEEEGADVRIKWPNDLVIGKKKICGILTEMKLNGSGISHVIIGVGINANTEYFPEEIADKATSLRRELGRKADSEKLIDSIMENFEMNYDRFAKQQDLSFIQDEYNELLVNRNREVRILEPGNEYEATKARNKQHRRTSGAEEKWRNGNCIFG